MRVGPVSANESARRGKPLGASFRTNDSSAGPGNEVGGFGPDVVVGCEVVDAGGLTVVVGAVFGLLLEHPYASTANAEPATRTARVNTGATLLPARAVEDGNHETSGIHSSGYVDGAKNHDSIA
jgi:hypothetical protein